MFSLSGCLEEFQELNTDPEKLVNPDPRVVFTGATENFNNSSRAHLTGKYSGVMTYMQYLVPTGGASEGSYYDATKTNSHPSPYMPAYSDYYNTVGLRLDYLLKNVVPIQAQPERYADVAAISQILLNYKQWQVLDTYGAAPITDAFKGQSHALLTPKYDLYQKSIDADGTPMYKKIDAEVKAAIAVLEASDENQYALGQQDFFYNGDVQKWIKFGNTLRIKMAQRVEKADAAFYNSVISEVATSADKLIAANDESCIYYHPNDYNNNVDDIHNITQSYCASAAFVNFLKEYNDPRLPIMVRRNGFGDKNNNKTNDEYYQYLLENYPDYETTYAKYAERYVGLSANPDSADTKFNGDAYLTLQRPQLDENGQEVKGDDGETIMLNFDVRMHSQIESRYYVKNGGKNGNSNMNTRAIESTDYEVNQDKITCFTPILTYPETCFMMAEIAIKKGSSVAGKSANDWYRAGIRASMEQYKEWAENMYVIAQVNSNGGGYNPLTAEKIDEYLAQSEFQTATLEKIISQQWIHLFMQPEEMWATWKRTGLPAFKDVPTPANGVAFLETIRYSENELLIPRRNAVPTPNSLNMPNYNEAIEALKGDTKYGSDVYQTQGRIWWDAQ